MSMNDKQRVAEYAAQYVMNGMLVGLGTGSTADFFIQELARRCSEENLDITVVSSSTTSFIKALSSGLPMRSIEQVSEIDLYVDGADEVSPDLTLLKGQGADLVREKMLARISKKFVVLIDSSKCVERIGQKFSIPVEVMPFAWQLVKKQLEILGGRGDLRKLGNGLAMSSHGSLILDMAFPVEFSAAELASQLDGMPGVVEHGIFYRLAGEVMMVNRGEVEISRANEITI